MVIRIVECSLVSVSRDELVCMCISLWDIRFMPTRSVFTFFQTFLNFWRNAPKCRHLGGGMCMLFEICGKTPFQKCMGWGG